jgi:hydroxymethylglutaryl-CoA lyase
MTPVTLVEVGPRDGLQNEKGAIETATKIAFVDALSRSGLRRIEVTAFVSPKAVPQLADGEAVMLGIARAPNVRYGALVPNETGLARALAAKADEVAVFTAASESFNQRNVNASIAESLARFAPVAAEAKRRGLPLRGYVSTAFWCPFEGRVQPAASVAVVHKLFDLGCYEVSIGDTIGKASPKEVRSLAAALASVGVLERCAGHFHDTYGMAAANVLTAFEAGIGTFDGSAGGLGGCPFAPGATGNVATEDLAWLFQGLGVDTGVDLPRLVDAARVIAPALGRPLEGRVFRALSRTPPAAQNPP